MADLTKRFGDVTACDGVSFEVRRGTIHALVGENGAGKTTLMRCAAGLECPESGEFRFDGTAEQVDSVEAARALGIGMVHQEFSVVDSLTLAENLVLGVEPTRHGRLDAEAIRTATERLDERTGWSLPWEHPAASVGVADLGRFELVRQLHRGADLLILDEPTAVLGPTEVDWLLATMEELRDSGHTIIFITHKLSEVMRVSDDITVLKGGQMVWSGRADETDAASVARAMVGADVDWSTGEGTRSTSGDEMALGVRQLSVVDHRGAARLNRVDLDVRRGEIVGVYGVAGSGQRALVEAIMALVAATGSVHLGGVDVTALGPGARRDSGLSFISPDRRHEGLAIAESILSNVVAGQQRRPDFSRRGVIDTDAWRERLELVRERYGVRAAGPDTPAGAMSGGNQQRLIVGREMEAGPSVLVASDPTRGVDIRGVADIHRFLLHMRDGGGAILLVSHELDEVLALADRVTVLLEGRVAGTIDRADATRAAVAELMTIGRAS